MFTVDPGNTKLNRGLDAVIAAGKCRLVISPNAVLVYELEALKNE